MFYSFDILKKRGIVNHILLYTCIFLTSIQLYLENKNKIDLYKYKRENNSTDIAMNTGFNISASDRKLERIVTIHLH